jgi:hypothetical protein
MAILPIRPLNRIKSLSIRLPQTVNGADWKVRAGHYGASVAFGGRSRCSNQAGWPPS